VPKGILADQQAVVCDAVREVTVPAGIDAIQARAHHGDRGPVAIMVTTGLCAFQRAGVCRAVDAQRQAGNDRESRLCEGMGKLAGVAFSLGGRVAAAHDGDRCGSGRRQRQLAHQVQQQRRVFDMEQRNGVGRVTQRRDPALDVAVCFFKPMPCALGQGLKPGWHIQQRGGLLRADQLVQRLFRLREHRLRQAERGQQLAHRGIAHTRGQRQSQPGGEFVAFHADRPMSNGAIACAQRRKRVRSFNTGWSPRRRWRPLR
jgi:hypothetical protein